MDDVVVAQKRSNFPAAINSFLLCLPMITPEIPVSS